MYYFESPTTDPYENLALEEYLFETLPKGAGLFMLWQNKDAVIVGRYQNTAEEINAAYVKAHDIAVVRRLSGGGAVFHDLGGLNYTIITDEGPEGTESPLAPDMQSQNADNVFQQQMAPLLGVLQGYGLSAVFSGRNDILADGKKIAGCAQYARDGRTLHHGCILFDSDLDKVAAALRPGEAKFISKSDKSVAARVATIRGALEEKNAGRSAGRALPDMAQFKRDLREAYAGSGAADKLQSYELTAEDRQAVARLCSGKYRTWEWNYGYRADYAVRRQQKFPAGIVTADMDVKEGVIERIRLSGDFFADRAEACGAAGQDTDALAALEEALTGLPLDEHLAVHLSDRLQEINGRSKGAGSPEKAIPIQGVTLEAFTQFLTGTLSFAKTDD